MMYSKRKQKNVRKPWNKGKLMGQKAPLTSQEIWAIRICLQNEGKYRDLALFNLAIDSKLRASDLLKIRVSDIATNGKAHSKAMISQQKTRQPVRFEITERTRNSIERWIKAGNIPSSSYLFPSRQHASPHLSARQYARMVGAWVSGIGLDPSAYGTHSMRRTKATLHHALFRRRGHGHTRPRAGFSTQHLRNQACR